MKHKKQAFQLIEEIVKQNKVVWNNPRGIFDQSLEYDMLTEEVQELKQAKKPVDQLDALLDVIYVAIGSLHKLGLTPEQMVEGLQIVQDANSQKSGSKNADGKVTKPENFIPPEEKLQKILDNLAK